MLRLLTIILLLLVPAASLSAGEYNATLSIGDKAPGWTELPGVDGRKHSLSDLESKDVVVVAFTCSSCPYAVDYEDRMIAFAKKHAADGKVTLVAVNVNKIEADSLPKMTERAKEKGFNFPYLFDETQQIGKDFGATRTPEFFVLDKQRKVIYMGAMDDSSDPAKVSVRYVDDAVKAALEGKTPRVEETLPVGCAVRYERARRTRN